MPVSRPPHGGVEEAARAGVPRAGVAQMPLINWRNSSTSSKLRYTEAKRT